MGVNIATPDTNMICRFYQQGQKLDVAGLNEITVLIDRSETERTEVALNSWRPGLDGPPHKHEQKEQIFFILNGCGTVKIGSDLFEAAPGDLFYVPANVVHQTINKGGEALEYLLFNAFLEPDKEGHASFAEHVSKVKETRKLQAETQHADAGSPQPHVPSQSRGRRMKTDAGSNRFECSRAALLERSETQRCEAILTCWRGNQKSELKRSGDTEETLFVVAGSGLIGVGNEAASASRGDVVFVPRKVGCVVTASSEGLKCLSLNAIVSG